MTMAESVILADNKGGRAVLTGPAPRPKTTEAMLADATARCRGGE